MVNAVFTGLYRYSPDITNMTFLERIKKIRDNGIDNIYWYVWKGHAVDEISKYGVKIVEIEEPCLHVRGIPGRQRQIYNVERSLQDFSDNDIVLKLRWDLDFDDTLLRNITNPDYFEPVENGVIGHKVWVGFYNIQELFSPADTSFAGYKKDLNKLINYEYIIDNISANNYISHDGMMLMPVFIEKNRTLRDLIKLDVPDPWTLMFKEEHTNNKDYIDAWAYNYYIFYKYFKTGPLGTCFFKRGDMARWPLSIVNYNDFRHNYNTITGKTPKMGLYPQYRVYDDIFVDRVVNGHYKDEFAISIYNSIQKNKETWEKFGV